MKKLLIMICALILMFTCSCGSADTLKINWKISVPSPDKIENIYDIDHKEGSSFEKWYFSDEKYNDIIKGGQFNLITDENIGFVNKQLGYQYNALTDEEKALFNEHFTKNNVVGAGDYFFCKAKDPQGNFFDEPTENAKTEILLYLDSETKIIYSFENVW